MNKPIRAVAAIAMASMALAACGGDSGSGTSGGGGGKKVVISSDLPLQGASKDASDSTNNAIKLYLKQQGNKAGKFTVEFKPYDDSTAAKGAWDDATCAKNATDHVANTDEVAVMGTYNSGCAKIEAPVLNTDPSGPMLMVSHANTNPGLTKKWDAGEPEKYFPSGKRNYARVITTDDYQGSAAAQFASQKLGVKKVFILNDNQTYGQGVGKAFEDQAKKIGMTVLGNEPWDAKQTTYSALFTKIKGMAPDMVYLAGIYDNNGGQLVKDKVSVLGDNTGVKLMAPDGFTGYPELQKLAQGEGLYLTFGGLPTDQLLAGGGAAKKLLDDYKAEYGAEPASSYALYGVAAVQVILAAIEKSDGTRKGVTDAVFTGEGITIPADKAAIGKEIKIDPKTGDTSAKDISVLQLKAGKEAFVQAQPVS
ncbi:MAG: branched-chain amino acid ABC transporter substrate-binding protein [Kineosporiaceae bacterium]